MDVLMGVISFVAQIPAVGKYLGMAVMYAAAASAAVSAIVAFWHAVVAVLKALGMAIPALSDLAQKMSALDSNIDAEKSVVLSFLDRLSVLPLPQKK